VLHGTLVRVSGDCILIQQVEWASSGQERSLSFQVNVNCYVASKDEHPTPDVSEPVNVLHVKIQTSLEVILQ
jgi:hypothetical protein